MVESGLEIAENGHRVCDDRRSLLRAALRRHRVKGDKAAGYPRGQRLCECILVDLTQGKSPLRPERRSVAQMREAQW